MQWCGLMVLGTTLVGCSCGDLGGGTNSPNTITIQSYQFSPSNLSVKPGAVITVVNRDSDPHSVTSSHSASSYTHGSVNGVAFDTGSFNGTASFTLSPSASPGTVIPYYCTVHGTMMGRGTITVASP